MRLHLETRGHARLHDYLYLNGSPPSEWWTPWAIHLNRADGEALVHSDGSRFFVMLANIPSVRRDITGAPIRSRLVIEVDVAHEEARRQAVVAVLAHLSGQLGPALDNAFPQEAVEEYFAKIEHQNLNPEEVEDRLAAALGALVVAPAADGASGLPESWTGRLGDTAGEARWRAFVAGLATGQSGLAACLPGERAERAEKIRRTFERFALLVPDGPAEVPPERTAGPGEARATSQPRLDDSPITHGGVGIFAALGDLIKSVRVFLVRVEAFLSVLWRGSRR